MQVIECIELYNIKNRSTFNNKSKNISIIIILIN